VVKKRTPTRKASSKKKPARKAARPARKAAAPRARAAAGGVDFNPVKKQLRAHIAKLERQLGGPEARATAVDLKAFDTLDQLKALNQQLSDLCQPTMVIPNT
jgi:uncharacterized protein (DUF1501 family)